MVAPIDRRGGAAPRDVNQILSTKLAPPAPPAAFVRRPRLEQQLDSAVARRVTLVSAHAGTGKTVLLAAWAAPRRDVAWLTLDRGENWSPRFWAGVEQALDRLDGSQTAQSDRRDDPVGRIVRRTAASPTPIVLVLDDLHEIENPIVLKEIDALLANAPRMLHVVLATRADPPLRLQRLRLAGELAELRAGELTFDRDECRALLGPLAKGLSDDDIDTLLARTEGWAAGIRLAALSLEHEDDRRRFIARFAGNDRAVAEYLLTEILDRQPRERRNFLLRASVPDVLSPELAVALSGNPAAGRMLEDLDAENFLVSSHEPKREAFRLHGLFRDFLRAQHARDRPQEVRIVNRRCARWFADNGDPDSAFHHAVVGEDWDLADELTAVAWHTIVLGVGARALDYTTAVPPAAVEGRPGLAIRLAAELLATGDRIEAEAVFKRAVAELADVAPDRRALLAPLVETFRIGVARLDGDHELVASSARVLLELPMTGAYDVARRAGTQRASALSSLGGAQLAAGELDEAERNLEEALAVAAEFGVDVVALNSISELAMLASARGQLRRVVEYGNEALEFARRRMWEQLYHLTPARLALAWAYYNWDEPGLALEQVEHTAMTAQHWGDRSARVGAALLSARLLAAEGPDRASKGLRRLRGVRSELNGWTPPSWLVPYLGTAEARLLAARGDLDAAESALDSEPTATPDELVMRVRLSLARGESARALDQLNGSSDAGRDLDLPTRIEARVLEAVAARESHDRARASRVLEDALALAEAEHVRRPFLDGGPAVQALLVDQIRQGTSHRALVADLIVAFERHANTTLTKAELLEPLSDRERAVLSYLPTMMSNAEIASELFVSINTVKTHLKSVYRKLGTTRRRDAVELARRLDLL